MRLVSESILICSSNFPHKKPSSCCLLVLQPQRSGVFHGKAPTGKLPCCCCVESQGNQRATSWPHRLSGLVAFYQQHATISELHVYLVLAWALAEPCLAPACLCMSWACLDPKSWQREGGGREGSHRQALFIRLLGGAKAQGCCGGTGGLGRAHQCLIRLGILTDMGSW